MTVSDHFACFELVHRAAVRAACFTGLGHVQVNLGVVPKANVPKKSDKAYEGLTIHGVERIEEAMQVVRGLD